ncbi:MAG: hypothetical protein ACE37L_11265 [Allomuricauda sp.]|nr:hypothetical protein [Allomuricauda sp.]MBO6533435.1 hypothetical protein [Allomuricauda sp.]MBO6588069.1 hypothetical protein [Allomuricauda sp.]MBO6617694.1 hypothetical protein [Allomuricauda sp.]MBO6643295.1 hypothetical protein [Allomuricauda sp.]MBO6746029.1 hypothetical protein [Allomuricauda sp.]
MKRNLLVFIIGIIVCSCELTYEDNTRLLVDGQVISFESNEIPELPVDVYALGTFTSFPSRREQVALIGESKLRSDGQYQVITISPENSDFISVAINDIGKNRHNASWPTLEINGLQPFSLENFKYQVPDISIGPLENTSLLINRVANMQDTLSYGISYNSTLKEVNLNFGEFDDEVFQRQLFGELYPSDMTREIPLRVIQGDSIKISYSLINNGIVGRGEIKIQYNTDGYTFDF